MKTFKIYGQRYQLSETSAEAPDAYGFRGVLTEEVPPGKKVGYVLMPDDSIIECYKKFNPLIIIIPILLVILIAVAIVAYLVFLQPKDAVGPGGFSIKRGVDKDIVSYNGFMSIVEGELSIDFQNGSIPATVSVEADGVEVDSFQVEPEEFVSSVPATFTSTNGVVKAKVIITTDTSTTENDVIIEIPENNTGNSPDTGLDGYWEGEYIYGTDPEKTE